MSAIDELLDQDNWYWSNDVNSVAVFGLDKDAYLPKASAELAALKSELERMRAVVDAAKKVRANLPQYKPGAPAMSDVGRLISAIDALSEVKP